MHRMKQQIVSPLLLGVALSACQSRSDHARFEGAFGLPLCSSAKVVWHPRIVADDGSLSGHSYGAEAVAGRDCLDQLWKHFQKRTGSACTRVSRCVGHLSGQHMAIEDKGRSMMVKVLFLDGIVLSTHCRRRTTGGGWG